MVLRQHGPFVGFALAVCVLMAFAGEHDLFAQRPPQNPMTQTRYTPRTLGYELVWEDDFKGYTRIQQSGRCGAWGRGPLASCRRRP